MSQSRDVFFKRLGLGPQGLVYIPGKDLDLNAKAKQHFIYNPVFHFASCTMHVF